MSVTCKGPVNRPAEDGVGNRTLTALPTRAIILRRRGLSTARGDECAQSSYCSRVWVDARSGERSPQSNAGPYDAEAA